MEVEDLNSVDLGHLERLLVVLRSHGVTRVKLGPVEIDVALAGEDSPTTFHDIDVAQSSRPFRPSSAADVKFPGSR